MDATAKSSQRETEILIEITTCPECGTEWEAVTTERRGRHEAPRRRE